MRGKEGDVAETLIQKTRDAINQAKRYLDDDPHLANFILRDLEATKEAGLSDLAWAMHKNPVHKNDVLGLIEHLEDYLSNVEDEHPERGITPMVRE